jgi:hypothetical protein
VAAFRAPIYFINLWLISDRHRYCTYLYYLCLCLFVLHRSRVFSTPNSTPHPPFSLFTDEQDASGTCTIYSGADMGHFFWKAGTGCGSEEEKEEEEWVGSGEFMDITQ